MDAFFLPQTDNETAKKLFDGFKGHEVLTTSNGTLLINGVSFASLENIATEGDDTLTGTAQNDKIIALSGNDLLDGKEGSDIIEAGIGDDTIIGGKGNDLLRGGTGNDTYLYNKGDGIDTIEEIGGTDRIVFGAGIAHDGILTAIAGNDLIIALKDGSKPFNELSDHDTLQFGEGITIDDLKVKFMGNDLLIALKEEGKAFDQLSGVITLKNYKNGDNTLSTIAISDTTNNQFKEIAA